MHPSQMDEIVRRLVDNPNDDAAIAHAHASGQTDPRGYAMILEKVGDATTDTTYAAHWLSEAAQVWALTLSDPRRAATLLMRAVERDPFSDVAAERLAQLYRDKGDQRALVALHERRAKAQAAAMAGRPADPQRTQQLSMLHEQLGQLWQEAPLSQPKKAIDNYKKAFEIDPQAVGAIYAARELMKSHGDWRDALPLYALEIRAIDDSERQMALFRDEATLRQTHNDGVGATEALRNARRIDPNDAGLMYELATTIAGRITRGEKVAADERAEAAGIMVSLAEQYDGEHALAYSEAALDAQPSHERAMQLADHFARSLGRQGELGERWTAYLAGNPTGMLAIDARKNLSKIHEEAGKLEEAIAVLAPLRDDPDPSIAMRLTDLYTRAGKTSELAALIDRQASALPPAERAQKLVEVAAVLAQKGDKKAALAKYLDVLSFDPTQADALSFVEQSMRTGRQHKELRDLLLRAADAPGADGASSIERLREVATISEQHLKDNEGAIAAHRKILAIDDEVEPSRAALHRLLDKESRWDELAALLAEEARAAVDVEEEIALETKLADLHEKKRDDKKAASAALLRVLERTPKDEAVLSRAVDLLIATGESAHAASTIEEHVEAIDDTAVKGKLFLRLAELRETAGDGAGAAEAIVRGAEALDDAATWTRAEEAAAKFEQWAPAARGAGRLAELSRDANDVGKARVRQAEYLAKAGDSDGAIERLREALEALPRAADLRDEVSDKIEQALERDGRLDEVASLVEARADQASDNGKAIAFLKRAARFRKERLADPDAARAINAKILGKIDDVDTLHAMVDDASERGDHAEAIGYLRRLEKVATTKDERRKIALREAALLVDPIGDEDAGLARYRDVLATIDGQSRVALEAIAALEAKRERHADAADALERVLEQAVAGEDRAGVARKLAAIYVDKTHELGKAIAALEVVRREDEGDFEALAQLRELSERAEAWPRVVELLDAQIEAEVDEDEIAALTAHKAELIADRLEKPEDALRSLAILGVGGSEVARKAAIAIAERHGVDALLGGQMLAWSRAAKGPEAQRLLAESFERFVRGGAIDSALEIAADVLRTAKGRDLAFLESIEPLAADAKNLDLVLEVHDRRASIAAGSARAIELVRQAKARARLGVSAEEAIAHGEVGLGLAAPESAMALLDELATIAKTPLATVEIYERQVARAKTPGSKLAAIAQAYRVALERAGEGGPDAEAITGKARELTEAALALPAASGGDEAFETLYASAKSIDDRSGGTVRRQALLTTIAASTTGPRDGGRSRAANLRRAAIKARDDLGDSAQALSLLATALVAHVDPACLDAIEEAAAGDPRQAESVLTRALEEVFDGPLVRQILARRAVIRQEKLSDVDGALADWKKLHELAPADANITERYDALLVQANDYRGRIQLLEDQILRSKEQGARAELARSIAKLWEERLGESREAADAWRRVLRLKPQDADATAGLDRAKRNKLAFEPGAHPPQRPTSESHAPSTAIKAAAPRAEGKSEAKIDLRSDAKSESKIEARSDTRSETTDVEPLRTEPAMVVPRRKPITVPPAPPSEPAPVSSLTTIATAAPFAAADTAPKTVQSTPKIPVFQSPSRPKIVRGPVTEMTDENPIFEPPPSSMGFAETTTTNELTTPEAAAEHERSSNLKTPVPGAQSAQLAAARALPPLSGDDDELETLAGTSPGEGDAASIVHGSPNTEEIAVVNLPAHLLQARGMPADETGEIVDDDEFEVIDDEEVAPVEDFSDLAEETSDEIPLDVEQPRKDTRPPFDRRDRR